MIKSNIKIGDTIYDIYGVAYEVLEINPNKVKLGKLGTDSVFFISEWISEETGVSYFYLKPPTVKGVPVYFEERPDIKIDDVVLVYRYSIKEWIARYFSHFDDSGNMYVFRFGANSITTEKTYKVDKYIIPNKEISIVKQLNDLNAEIIKELEANVN